MFLVRSVLNENSGVFGGELFSTLVVSRIVISAENDRPQGQVKHWPLFIVAIAGFDAKKQNVVVKYFNTSDGKFERHRVGFSKEKICYFFLESIQSISRILTSTIQKRLCLLYQKSCFFFYLSSSHVKLSINCNRLHYY